MIVGLFPMVADVLHSGHVLAIEEAKKHCDYLVVALHCNPVYKEPVQSIYERYIQLRAIKWIDEVIPYQNIEDVPRMLSSLQYDIYFLGSDYIGKQFEGIEILESLGKEIYYLSRNHKFSSTNLKARIKSNILEDAENNSD